LPAAKAALVALMQTTNKAAATISIVNLMAASRFWRHALFRALVSVTKRRRSRRVSGPDNITKGRRRCREIGPVLA
jgi:hypothetical protein